MKWTISILSLFFKYLFLKFSFGIIIPLCSTATFFFDNLYFFNKSNIEKFVLISNFLPFNCIFAIIELFNQKFSLLGLLKKFKINEKKIAVELNGKIIIKSKYNSVFLKDKDKIEIVHFIGGG